MEVKQGKVVYVVPEKGYGFIQCDDYQANLFFHARNLRNVRIEMLRKGDLVTFDGVVESERGLSCNNVKVIEE